MARANLTHLDALEAESVFIMREVAAEFLHLEGAIDEYQAQLVAFKADAANAALDWAAPEMEDVEFLHLNTVLERFIENLATLHGKLAWKLRNELKEMAA